MQLPTAVRYHCIPTEVDTVRHLVRNAEDVGKLEPLCAAMEMHQWSRKIALSATPPRDLKTCFHTESCTQMPIATLLMMGKGELISIPLAGKEISKAVCPCYRKFCSHGKECSADPAMTRVVMLS